MGVSGEAIGILTRLKAVEIPRAGSTERAAQFGNVCLATASAPQVCKRKGAGGGEILPSTAGLVVALMLCLLWVSPRSLCVCARVMSGRRVVGVV